MHNFFLSLLFVTTTALCMDSEKNTLVWVNPRVKKTDTQKHPLITELHEKVFFTPHGIEQARRYLEDRPASSSSFEGLDLACGSSRAQQTLKLTALLNAKRSEDPREFVLQETLCTHKALMEWPATLTAKPSLYRVGWTPDQDRQCAQAMLKTVQLVSELKNVYLKVRTTDPVVLVENINNATFSSDGRYAAGTNNEGCGIIVDVTSQEVIHKTTLLHPYDKIIFSPDNRFCTMQLAKHAERYFSNIPDKTTRQAFDLVAKKVIQVPMDCTTQKEFPIDFFSPSVRYGVLRPKTEASPHVGLCDTATQKMLVTFLEVERWDDACSLSPNEKYFLLQTTAGLKLYDLEEKGKEVTEFKFGKNVDTHKTKWSADSACCLLAQDVPDKDSQFASAHYALYSLYYPHNNDVFELGIASSNAQPSFSTHGRFCVTFLHGKSHLYDVRERRKLQEFEFVRCGIDCEILECAFFSEDTLYPYCIIPAVHVEGEGQAQTGYHKIIVFDLITQKIVEEVSNLKNVLFSEWPSSGPYYSLLYNYQHNSYTTEIRDKKTHALVLRIENGCRVYFNKDGSYALVETNNARRLLIDMISEQLVRKVIDWYPMPNGSIIERGNHRLYEALPADCDWSNITSQQICLILYALIRYHEGKPLTFQNNSNTSLRILFDSLNDTLQKYLTGACKITF